MKLRTWLERLSVSRLEHYRRVLDLQGEPGDPDFMEAAARRLSSQELLEAGLSRQRPWVKAVLRCAVVRFASHPFSMEELEREALSFGISGAHVKAALGVLRHYGWILALRKSWGDEVFLLPEDTWKAWQRLLVPGNLSEAPASVEVDSFPVGNPGCAAYDVLTLLGMLKDDGVLLTKTGFWPKPALKKLESLLIVEDDDLQAAGLAIRPQTPCGPAAAAVMDLALRSGLIAVRDGRWRLRERAVDLWTARPVSDVQRELYGYWLDAQISMEAWELHAFAKLEETESGKWYYLDGLFEWLRDCGMIKRIADGLLSEYVRTRLLPLQAMGWIRLCETPSGGYAFQLPFALSNPAQPEGETYQGLILQPDLEMILTPYPPLELLWKATDWSDTISRGDLFVLRLTRDSICRGIARGWDAEEILKILTAHSSYPIDARVSAMIRDWAGAERAVIRTGLALLELQDPLCRDILDGDPEARELLSECLGEGRYAVPLSDLPKLERHLERLGILALRRGAAVPDPGQEELDEAETELPAAILLPGRIEPVCTPSPEGGQDPFQGEWSQVPAAWLERLAAYHPSTRKDMIKKAIEWKAPVRIAGKGVQDWEIIPLSIRENGQGWAVEGLREQTRITVPADQWDQIRIILPGVSD
ncbi:helicase-associated domain-containing protein [Gorillibacterium sp. sgz5001074]|uniref:helicase-associated domain-containing protein n=1 Tax=Gorillibacterium sp. sgz5001074 TaxID=3446695 RepID=UPI003F66A8C2